MYDTSTIAIDAQSLGNTENERNVTYRELFRNHLDDIQVHAIRDALGQELVLGRDDFKDRIEQMLKRQTPHWTVRTPTHCRTCFYLLCVVVY